MSGPDSHDDAELLAHRDRRYLLYCLVLYTPPVPLAMIADQLAVWTHAPRPEAQYLRERLRIYNALYHDHLPVLCDADLVTYDQEDDMVDVGPAAERVEPVLSRALSAEIAELLRAEQRTFDADSE